MADENARSTPQSLVTQSSGKKGSTPIGNTLGSQTKITEGSDEEEVGVTITPDFVKSHRETFKARLAELEHREKLEKLKAQFSYSEDEPEGGGQRAPLQRGVVGKILKMLEEKKRPQTRVEENDEPRKDGGGPEDDEDPLLRPYHPTNYTDLSKFTCRIAKALLPGKLKLPENVGKYDGTNDPDDHLHAFEGAGKIGR
ncbi:hypothetical protein E3N88_11917 [Mikania micrantha]|uniref:Uncharacterized protein n=1 Tax=Mikania micrantha TaxID=192012 RepID=A0A5N6P5E4_9ASTR|nr:hypothetical protein E3N88_11917 [Mikania micrantha]